MHIVSVGANKTTTTTLLDMLTLITTLLTSIRWQALVLDYMHMDVLTHPLTPHHHHDDERFVNLDKTLVTSGQCTLRFLPPHKQLFVPTGSLTNQLGEVYIVCMYVCVLWFNKLCIIIPSNCCWCVCVCVCIDNDESISRTYTTLSLH